MIPDDVHAWIRRRIDAGEPPAVIAGSVASRLALRRGMPLTGGAPGLVVGAGEPAPDHVPDDPRVVGFVYEASLDTARRHRDGVHYTPSVVAAGLATVALDGAPPGPVCDPSVGGGAFLVAAGEVLVARGEHPQRVARELLWGIDLDPMAVEVARTVVGLWVGGPDWVTPGPHLAIADTLEAGASAFADPPAEGFAAVLGNPPFQSQLGATTARAPRRNKELRDRWATTAGPYADTAAYFLLAAQSMLGDGGRQLLIQPQSVLSSADAEPIRRQLEEDARLAGLWLGGRDIFDAEVEVCAPLLTRGTDVGEPLVTSVRRWSGTDVAPEPAASRRRFDPWAELVSDLRGVPAVSLSGPALSTRCAATAGFRDQFYGLAPHAREWEGPGDDRPALVTVGMIDPLRNRWGSGTRFRFARRGWLAPVVDLEALEADDEMLAAWVRARLRPKVLVATQTRVVEVIPDVEGRFIPSTPVVSVECDPADVWPIAAALSAPPVTAAALARTSGAALSADALKLTAKQVLDLPLPAEDPRRHQAWTAGTGAAERAAAASDGETWLAALRDLGDAMTSAYAARSEVRDWWYDRLPAWR